MTWSAPIMSAIRYGYGIRPGEKLASSPEDLLEQLRSGANAELRFPVAGIDAQYAMLIDYLARQDEIRPLPKPERLKLLPEVQRPLYYQGDRDQHARVEQAALSPFGFHERLASFWLDHFSVDVGKRFELCLLVPLYEAEAIRPALAGSFADLLKAAILHPAMLIYLDQVNSTGPSSPVGKKGKKGLNENLGRELLELHTLGVDGGYSQEDVRNAALVLTGLTFNRKTATTRYNARIAEPGPINIAVLDRDYGSVGRRIGDIHHLLEDLAIMPQTARHICRKLVVHFIADTPPQSVIDPMVETWLATGGDLFKVYQTMLDQPAAWQDPGQKARQPLDYVVAGLRAMAMPESAFAVGTAENTEAAPAMDMAMAPDADADAMEKPMKKKAKHLPENKLTIGALRKLGQIVWQPASPEGSEEAFQVWISAAQLTGRIAWAQALVAMAPRQVDPDTLMKGVLMDAARDDTIQIVSQAPSRKAGLVLVLASPEFNLR
jgi:uncharacterized protein (DUF1800 family)